MEKEHQYATVPFLYSLKKTKPKNEKALTLVLRLLILLVFSQHGLAFKYGNTFQMSICNLWRNSISDTWRNSCHLEKVITKT